MTRLLLSNSGEYRHLVHHARLAVESGVPEENTLVIGNYDLVELTPNSLKKLETIENERVLVEGRDGNDISRLMIKDRRQLGEKGVVFSIIVRNSDTRKVISGPEIIARGLVTENQEGWMIEEAKAVVKGLIQDYETALRVDAAETDLQEDIRIQLRRFFNQNIGRKPVVLSMILDI